MRWAPVLARASCLAVLLGGWCASPVSRASAQEPRAPASLYDVPEGCPDSKDWAQALGARLPEHLRAHPALRRLTIKVSRAQVEGAKDVRHSGELGTVDGRAGEVRRVSGASCAEVVQALTLIAALEVRAIATTAPAPVDAGAELPEAGRAATPPEAASPEDLPSSSSDAHDPATPRVGAVAFALYQHASSPRWTADVGVGVSLEWRTEQLQPWVMLGLYWGGDEVPAGDRAGVARFERWSTHVVGCPVRFPRQGALGVRPCASVDLGRLSGAGLRVNEASESAALLASAGAGVRLEWSPLAHLQLGALFGGVLSLSRPRFYFSPEFTALEVAPGGLRTGASATLSF
jgi:hypothetical protein